MLYGRRRIWVYLLAFSITFFLFSLWDYHATPWASHSGPAYGGASDHKVVDTDDDPGFFWRNVPVHYPVQSMAPLPTGKPQKLPSIQKNFPKESSTSLRSKLDRQAAVKAAFVRCWEAYKSHAWTSDEVTPISGSSRNTFGGWGATLVDSLDTLWIMDLRADFELAVTAAANISFETTTMEEINVFETNIRYLGGFLAAFDLSGDKRLLRKAKEVGELLYAAFDTPNRMPITRWNLHNAAQGMDQVAPENILLAEIGSFSMEFTRLSILTGDPKWFDAVQRITEVFQQQQDTTKLPGMWPVVVNGKEKLFNQHGAFTLGAMADSMFEYLPKTYALTGGLLPEYKVMYEKAMATAMKNNLYRPLIPDNNDILISAMINVEEERGQSYLKLEPEGQHLVCFAGGMLALGGKLLGLSDHLEKGQKLVDGCIWTYQALPRGIMPESFHMVPCRSSDSCTWDEHTWKNGVLQKHGKSTDDLDEADAIILDERLPEGFIAIGDTRYILRPEAIESVFILYRITGRNDLLESAWTMFEAIDKYTHTDLANSALSDITLTVQAPPKVDSMESFWMGETLKYFYLIFSDPSLISLDDFVFNTEAHPLKRLKR